MATSLEDEYTSNPLWQAIDDADLAARAKEALDPSDADRLRRVQALASFARSQKAQSAFLLPTGWRDYAASLAEHFTELTRQVNGWDAAGAMVPMSVAQIEASCDAILTLSAATWPPLSGGPASKQVLQIAKDFESSVSDEATRLRSGYGELTKLLEATEGQVDTLTTTVSAYEANLVAMATDAQATVKAATIAATTEVASVVAEGQSQYAVSATELSDRTSVILADLELKAVQAKRLITLIGGAGISDGYTKYADRQQRAAFGWNLAAVLLGVGAVFWIGAIFWEVTKNPSMEPTNVVLKTAVSVTALTVAGFMSRLGKHHRDQAVKARFRALDMIALGPFTEDLTERQRQGLKYVVGLSAFGPEFESEETQKSIRETLAELRNES